MKTKRSEASGRAAICWRILGRLLIGFAGDDLGRYARDLHAVDHVVTGDGDVISRLSRDLAMAGHSFTRADIEAALRRFHAQALKDTGCTE